jgi:hypothetical protein
MIAMADVRADRNYGAVIRLRAEGRRQVFGALGKRAKRRRKEGRQRLETTNHGSGALPLDRAGHEYGHGAAVRGYPSQRTLQTAD